jgi:uroporphyrinogen decarboxylase
VASADSAFLRACRGERPSHVPVWFMRQAGRSLPEYRALRSGGSILEAIRDPALSAEITLQPVRRYGVDAAILFSDIVVPLAAIGVGVEIVAGRGPVIDRPFVDRADLGRLRPLEPEVDTPFVLETIRLLRQELTVPLIGFAGAPFTVGSYFIEGGPTRDFVRTKQLMHTEPALFDELMGALAELSLASLRSQVLAGAEAVQLFDSWAGALSRRDYERHVLPANRRVLEGLADLRVPRIHFGVGTGELLDLMVAAGADVLGVDWRVPLPVAAERAGAAVPLQGNLDPTLCLAGFDAVEREARLILDEGRALPGHIFNLGHGVLPGTDPDVLARLVDLVHAQPTRRPGANDAAWPSIPEDGRQR